MSLTDVDSYAQDLVKTLKRRKMLHCLIDHQSNEENSQTGNSFTRLLESNPIRIVTLLLLTLDLILTILELSFSILSCTSSYNDDIKSNDVVTLRAFRWVGTAVISLLLMKSVALAVCLKTAFFKRPGYVLDGVVLILAMVLEVGLDERGGGLIVVVSLWRVLRILEGVFEISDEAIEKKMEMIMCQLDVVKEENMMLRNEVVLKDKEIDELRRELEELHGRLS